MKQFFGRLFRPRVKQWNLNKTIGWKSDQETLAKSPILFVQLQFSSSVNLEAISENSKRLEQLINANVESKNVGKLFTSELIERNYTLLFVVKNYNEAAEVIKDTIQQEDFEHHFLIARRVYQDSFHWKYKIFYPKKSSLKFVEME